MSFLVMGAQSHTWTFDVYTTWHFAGSGWVGSDSTTVTVPNQSNTTTFHRVDVVVVNASDTDEGTSSFQMSTSNLRRITGGADGQALTGTGTATVHVAFSPCEGAPEPPTLTLPDGVVQEATGVFGAATGAVVEFADGIVASDHEGTDITHLVTCTPASGSVFAIGASEVECFVTDSGGREASGSFFVYVQDTTAPVFTNVPDDSTLIATDIHGVALDLSSFTITAEDQGPNGEPGDVSGPVSIDCTIGSDAADGYQIAIGQTVTVLCTATDDSLPFRAPGHDDVPSPNTSEASMFDVFVTLGGELQGLLAPIRADGSSNHKRGSTVPHKFLPPLYADGSAATDLAAGLRLVLYRQDAHVASSDGAEGDLSAGSTAWRFDDSSGHYIFNLKSSNKWLTGQYESVVSFADIDIATGTFNFSR